MSEIFDYFSGNYAQARRAFREAAASVGAALHTHHNPATGPGGIELSTETARLGAQDAERLLVVISGTHGVECFCGSGLQVGLLKSGLAAEMPRGTAILLIHAINPSGFAWVRRVTEDNVDLNRNFVDHARPHPVNAAYDELREAICPRDWINGQAAADATLEAFRQRHGIMALQSAISSGQYGDPEGVFYGGRDLFRERSTPWLWRSRWPLARRSSRAERAPRLSDSATRCRRRSASGCIRPGGPRRRSPRRKQAISLTRFPTSHSPVERECTDEVSERSSPGAYPETDEQPSG